jgi:hypothetical protein
MTWAHGYFYATMDASKFQYSVHPFTLHITPTWKIHPK